MKRLFTPWITSGVGQHLVVATVVTFNLSSHLQGAVTDPAALLQQGKFREAQAAYETLAGNQPEDPRWRYNAGVAAFRAGDPTTAQKHFEAAAGAADLDLQERAWYNLGSTWFQQASAPDAEDREGALKKAEEAFTAATQLAPQDRAATDNLAAVKKYAEELRKQQQEQQDQPDQSSKDGQKGKGQKSKKGQSGKNGKPNSSPDKPEEDASQPGDQSPDKPNPKDQAGKSKKEKESSGKDSQDGEKGEGEKKAGDPQSDVAHQPTNAPTAGSKTNQMAKAGGDKSKDPAGGEKGGIQRGEGSDPAGAEGQAAQLATDGERMTVAQAQQMLDAQKGAEKPIWTLIRGWGQENQAPPSASGRRKTW